MGTIQGDVDSNVALDISKGGTNATTASGARQNLGISASNNAVRTLDELVAAEADASIDTIVLDADIAPATNLTITKVFFPNPGCVITPATGITVTVNHLHKGVGAWQWFSIADGGSLIFPDGALDDAAYAEWVGAQGDCVLNDTTGLIDSGTDDTTEINAIFASGAPWVKDNDSHFSNIAIMRVIGTLSNATTQGNGCRGRSWDFDKGAEHDACSSQRCREDVAHKSL